MSETQQKQIYDKGSHVQYIFPPCLE